MTNYSEKHLPFQCEVKSEKTYINWVDSRLPLTSRNNFTITLQAGNLVNMVPSERKDFFILWAGSYFIVLDAGHKSNFKRIV